jgi:cytochrome c oxidase cbb3-type subunit 3
MSSRCLDRPVLRAGMLLAFALTACAREERSARPPAQLATLAGGRAPDDADAGLTGGVAFATGPDAASPPNSRPTPGPIDPYEGVAYELAEGKRLFYAYNCNGCHAQGGGAIGPALSDGHTRYGEEPQQIYATVVYGRPNGMPSFRGKISEAHAWRLVAYVRSLAGLASPIAAPSRSDHLSLKSPENALDRQMMSAPEGPARP